MVKRKKRKRRTRKRSSLAKDLIGLSETVVAATTAVQITNTLSGAIKKK